MFCANKKMYEINAFRNVKIPKNSELYYRYCQNIRISETCGPADFADAFEQVNPITRVEQCSRGQRAFMRGYDKYVQDNTPAPTVQPESTDPPAPTE